MHGLHVRTATDELARFAAAPVQQDRELPAETRMIERSLLSLEYLLQNGQPLRGHCLRDLPFGGRCGRARARAVLEGVGPGIAYRSDKPERGLEILVRFARKTNDEVGTQRQIGARRPQSIDEAAVVVGTMPAIHRRQNAIRSGLHRQMQKRHELWYIRMSANQVVVLIGRMRGRVSDPLDAPNFGERSNQSAEPPIAAVAPR